jgi:hypothetical protein
MRGCLSAKTVRKHEKTPCSNIDIYTDFIVFDSMEYLYESNSI